MRFRAYGAYRIVRFLGIMEFSRFVGLVRLIEVVELRGEGLEQVANIFPAGLSAPLRGCHPPCQHRACEEAVMEKKV